MNDERVADLYKKMYNLVRTEITDDELADVSVALSALASLASTIAVSNNITRESYLRNCAYMFDALDATKDDHDLH
jgi:hypothetical protein